MDFRRDPADEAFRQEIKAFLKEKLPCDMAARNGHGYHSPKADTRAWTKILFEKGWSVPSWPVEFGGPGWSPMQQFIFDEECCNAGAPLLDIFGLKMVGPVIYTFGNEDLRRRFLEPFRRGEITWAQGFSEPNSGSDLASLKSQAVRDGDEYVITGRKIWTSGAHEADFIFFLLKTDLAQKKKGVSMILVDAKAPGVTIRPIIDISGNHSLNEVFLDEVRVPVENLIGEEGEGWVYAKFLLENERAFAAEIPLNRRNLARLKTMAAYECGSGRRLIDDPAFAARIAQLEADLLALEFMTLRVLTDNQGADGQGHASDLPVGSILKIRGSELTQKIGEMQIEALGDYGSYFYEKEEFMANPPGHLPGPDYAPGILAEFMYRRAASIYGGTNEIQRTIIARQFLGL